MKKRGMSLLLMVIIILLVAMSVAVTIVIINNSKINKKTEENINTGIQTEIPNKENSSKESNYISLDIPLSFELSLEEDYIEKQIYTFVYNSDRDIERIIFTNKYHSKSVAKTDYETMKKNNNYSNDWNMPRKFLTLKDDTITYEYEENIVDEYYSDFIGSSVDDMVSKYGANRVLKDFVPNVPEEKLLSPVTEKVTNNNSTVKTEQADFELMAKQAEQKLGQNYTTNYNEAFNKSFKYYATVDRNSIKYTDEYSKNGNYYVMNATVKNSSTNITVGKYLIRCKWDKQNNTITDYGDNSRAIIVLNVYETALHAASKGIGVFYIDKAQYKNDALWETEKINKNSLKNVLSAIDKLDYYYYEYSANKDEAYFEKMKSGQASNIKKVISCKEVNMHIVQIVTDDEVESALTLTDYINSEFYLANDKNMSNLIEFSKKTGLYYNEVLRVNS